MFTEDERLELCAWFRANGIDPDTVPVDFDLSITMDDGQRILRYTEYVRDEKTGNILANQDGHAKRRTASVPCVIDPPSWLNVSWESR